MSILINKASWAKLNDQQKKVIGDAAAWIEAQAAEVTKENEAETAKQAAAGIQVISSPTPRRPSIARKPSRRAGPA